MKASIKRKRKIAKIKKSIKYNAKKFFKKFFWRFLSRLLELAGLFGIGYAFGLKLIRY